MSEFLSLSGKTFLITGGTSGIGKATCEQAIKYGARVVVIGRDKSRLKSLKSEFTNNVITVNLDLFNADVKNNLFDFIPEEVKIHGFLHAAGISPTMPINREDATSWNEAMRLNVYSAIEIAQWLIKNHRSTLKSIVYISSVMAELAEKAKGTYGMSKAALNAIARNQALEYAKYNVRVNTIAPAVVNTPLTKDSLYRKNDVAMKAILDKHPLGLGEPYDIANAALFLLSDASRWITGSTLTIDGGYSLK